MAPTDDSLYSALLARDARFDGIFYVGVTSTGIYCRPVCPVKPPQKKNCRFFDSRELAEDAGFRPCLRCRPEISPGYAPMDDAKRIAQLIAQRLEEGMIEGDSSIEDIAAQFDLSSRQIRRIVHKELGVSPIALLQTRRLLLAKQLLSETQLPVTDIAFASGFSSLRRFNDAFLKRYGMPPSRLRKQADATMPAGTDQTSRILLGYRPPYDWDGMLAFLQGRMLKGVEWVSDDTYWRTVSIDKYQGWIAVRHAPAKNALSVEFSHGLTPVLPVLLNRLRDMLDLGARPDLITAHLSKDKRLRPLIKRNPGLRVPGCFDSFELAVRAILGQQVTVKAATTLGCRFVTAFGTPIVTPIAELDRLTPTAASVADLSRDDIARLGIVGARAHCIIALAQAYSSGALRLTTDTRSDDAIAQLTALPGIGPWTAQYIAMRALRWPDAFPKEDIAARKNLGGLTAAQAEAISQPWRPWRSYALLHIWRSVA